MELDDKEKRAFLKDEYLLLQNQYEDFDRRSLMIKGWIGSGSVAALALSFNVGYKEFSLAIPVIVCAMALIFWYMEAQWKLFQYALSDRIRSIEAYFRGDSNLLEKSISPFQVYISWSRSYFDDRPIFQFEIDQGSRGRALNARLWSATRLTFVFIPYLPIIVVSFLVLLALANKA